MALVKRIISTTFILGEGAFGESGSNTVEVATLRASAAVSNAGGASGNTLSLDIWGMTPSLMGQLATMGPNEPTLSRKNLVVVKAGDDVNGVAIAFSGTITNGYSDYQSSPQVPFHVEASASSLFGVAAQLPTAFPQGGDVATMLSGLADVMDLKFEPNGVQRTLPASYFSGSALKQVQDICEAAGIDHTIDSGILAIWDPSSSRGGLIPLIDKDHGLIGYPAWTFSGIIFKSLYNPNLNFGGRVNVQSSRPELIKLNGEWTINRIDHNLDSELPGGNWYSTVQAYRNSALVVPTPT